MLEMHAGKDGLTQAQMQMFEALGINPEAREIMLDLSRQAAKQAMASIETVANTAPDPRMMNSIMLSACLMLGRAADRTVSDWLPEALSEMPPHIRTMAEKIIQEEQPKVRDFDGNYK